MKKLHRVLCVVSICGANKQGGACRSRHGAAFCVVFVGGLFATAVLLVEVEDGGVAHLFDAIDNARCGGLFFDLLTHTFMPGRKA